MIQELRTQVQALKGTLVTQSQPPTYDTISVSQRSQKSQSFTTNTSIMGGRSAQAQNHQLHLVGAVTTQPYFRSATPNMKLWRDPPANTVADNKCDTNADMC